MFSCYNKNLQDLSVSIHKFLPGQRKFLQVCLFEGNMTCFFTVDHEKVKARLVFSYYENVIMLHCCDLQCCLSRDSYLILWLILWCERQRYSTVQQCCLRIDLSYNLLLCFWCGFGVEQQGVSPYINSATTEPIKTCRSCSVACSLQKCSLCRSGLIEVALIDCYVVADNIRAFSYII